MKLRASFSSNLGVECQDDLKIRRKQIEKAKFNTNRCFYLVFNMVWSENRPVLPLLSHGT